MVTENKRQFYRLTLQVPLSARFRVIGYRDSKVNTNSSPIYIADISAGGLRMHSRLNLPINEGLLLEFNVELFHQDLVLLGSVLRKTLLRDRIYEYGVEFILDEVMRNRLLSNIHMLSIRLRHTEVLASCSFCSLEEVQQFYGAEFQLDKNDNTVF